MKKFLLRLFSLLFLFIAIASGSLSAQSLPSDLSNTNISELSDSQIKQIIQQASQAGYSDDQIIQAAQSKGLSSAEAQKLRNRISLIRRTNGSAVISGKAGMQSDSGQTRRKLNYTADGDTLLQRDTDIFQTVVPKVFGSDIFTQRNLTFAPNLKLATPKNYIVGPDDQLNISVYGNSLVNWKLDVSPEGNINIPGIGPVSVTGKSIEQATADIRRKLIANKYAIGKGSSLQVSLGDIRSIKVIIVGEVSKPGTYTLPSLATAFNALYAAGGPNKNGTYRQIEIIRDNRIIRTLDVYDFLVKGNQKNNVGLQDQDIIRVPSYRTHVQLSGEVKTPAVFETLPGETFADVLRFAGGFTDQAYSARIRVLQVSDQQRRITDVLELDFKNYIPLRGDKYIVDRILDRYENRVTIKGAVFRPGDYQLDKGLTLSGLVDKAAGLKEDAFGGRAVITRLKPDNTKEIVAVNLTAILNKSAADVILQREDSVYISSIFDLRDKYMVTIKGQIRNPGNFDFAENMKVADLILKAGGLSEGASPKRIEVSQRINNSDPNSAVSRIARVYSIDLTDGLNLSSADFVLHPYDIVSVYSLPGYEKQRTVKVEGEVLYPGYYTLKTKNEKISDIIKRAGSLTASADVTGSSLKRNNSAILGANKNQADSTVLQAERKERLNHLRNSFKDSSVVDNEPLRNNYIGIDLAKILDKPGSNTDLILEDGDVLRVPKQQQVVRINGEVLYPSAVVYEKGKTFDDFVSNAGGYSPQALKRGAYVVYPNGTVKGTRKFLFFNNHPNVKPGSEIYVPKKPERKGNAQEFIGITTALASLGAIILGIITLRR
jgi:protein involved in polysaccharide export with SLBB domain